MKKTITVFKVTNVLNNESVLTPTLKQAEDVKQCLSSFNIDCTIEKVQKIVEINL